ncbi:hypothetical protein GCM10023196_035960 [Actinoallomurus vinaceus]|uniref:HTH cro/C1-type domain-containing protein n=1 Tax=Actinoallomurus vinaceus TaxID=1080074 RepID=A0ABP8UCR1_9ACTN
MPAPLPLVTALREERRRQGLTQAEVACRAGYTRSSIGGYETGSDDPSMTGLICWAGALGLQVAFYPPLPGLPPPPPPPELSPEVAELMQELIHTLAEALGVANNTTEEERP